MAAQQFYKQALILLTLEAVCKTATALTLTDDRKISGSLNLVLNSSITKYFKNTQNFSTRVLLFYLELTGAFYAWLLCNHLSYALFFFFLFSF